ncbi:hypothetical protein O6H91_12G038500 [Diphasiastrum complanatum]|nr:hypothetical protein O6H91_12G038500 [Diphasiastrum complanatum]
MSMEVNWGPSLEDEGEILGDPVLSYITEMLMDEEMEERPCMFMESSAYRTMADELAGLLRDPSNPLDGISKDPLGYEDDVFPSFTEGSFSGCSSDNLFDDILNNPMNKEVADFLDSDSSTLEHSLAQRISFGKEKLEDRWIYDPPDDRSDSWAGTVGRADPRSSGDHPTLSQRLSGSVELRETSTSSCSLREGISLPTQCTDRFIGEPETSFGRTPLNDEGFGNGRMDLFKMLQKSVTSHIGKAKKKPYQDTYNENQSTNDSRSNLQEKGKSLENGNFQRTSSGRYVQLGTSSVDGGKSTKPDTDRFSFSNDVKSLRQQASRSQLGHEMVLNAWKADSQLQDEGGVHSYGEELLLSERSKERKYILIDLLEQCAQQVACGDMRKANQMLREIREEATPFGDGKQRLAFYFIEALVARISGTGGCLYAALDNNRPSAVEMLKAYHLRIENCPFVRICHFFSNQTIINACEVESRLHVVDYGILYGFQWPSLIQTLGSRPGGPPHLRITGIDFPQPGFKPAERVEDTGRRLAEYARAHGVPFEYQAIAISRWEDIQPSSLFLRHDEVLAVNCMFRLRHLLDETVMADSPRKKLLARIRSMNPKVFVEAVVNAGYNSPFGFMTRFQESLAHFDSIFDAIDSCVARDHPDRRLLEQEIFGREILNVVACEGPERVERAEPYKHWQSRTQRAGFHMMPLDPSICHRANTLMGQYHPDYTLAEDDPWLLIAWRGRYSRAVSAWRSSP